MRKNKNLCVKIMFTYNMQYKTGSPLWLNTMMGVADIALNFAEYRAPPLYIMWQNLAIVEVEGKRESDG